MNSKKQDPLKRFLNIRGMRGAMTAFVGLIVIYIAFGMINPTVFSGQNVMNLLRSMSKYLIIGIGQSYVLITGNIDLSIGSVVGMSAMISATLMTHGITPAVAIMITLCCCLAIGVINGILVGNASFPRLSQHWDHVRGQRRGLHGKRKQEYRRYQLRNRQGGGRRISESVLLRKDSRCLQHLLDCHYSVCNILFPALQDENRPSYYAIGSNVEAAKLSKASA